MGGSGASLGEAEIAGRQIPTKINVKRIGNDLRARWLFLGVIVSMFSRADFKSLSALADRSNKNGDREKAWHRVLVNVQMRGHPFPEQPP